MNERIKDIIKKLKNPTALIIIGFCGIVLIFLSSFTGNKSPKKQESELVFSAIEYKSALEKDICEMVAKITGSENVSVMITLDSGIRYSYADTTEGTEAHKTENNTASSSEELKQSYVTVKTSDGGEDALLVAEIMPEIRGVAIVCDGGDNEYIREKISSAVMAALNITSKRVYIAGGKNYENQ